MDQPDALTEPFVTAAATALAEMAGVVVVARGAGRDDGEEPEGVSAALRLNADAGAGRWAVLSLPRGTASALARRILAGAAGEPDAGMVRDCAAELLNVIAGQAKTMLVGTPDHFTFTTPTAPSAGPAAAGRTVIRFDSDAGPFTIHLCPPAAGAVEGNPNTTRPGE